MKTPPWVIVVLIVIMALLLWLYLKPNGVTPHPRKVTVNCNEESLADKVRGNPEANTFVVSGECRESNTVTIVNDGVTIDGQGAVITGVADKAVIAVERARDVTIKNLEATKGKVGILISKGAGVSLDEVNASENKIAGLCVLGSDPVEESSGKTLQYQNRQRPSDPTDNCVAAVPPNQEPIDQAPQSQEEPLSSGAIWNALISDAVAQPLSVGTSTTVCSRKPYKNNPTGIMVWGFGVTLTVSGTNCKLYSNNNDYGLSVGNNAKVKLQGNAKLHLKNKVYDFFLNNGKLELFGTSKAFLNKSGTDHIEINSSNVTCSNSSSISGEHPLISGC